MQLAEGSLASLDDWQMAPFPSNASELDAQPTRFYKLMESDTIARGQL
jgi:hypothetical protein